MSTNARSIQQQCHNRAVRIVQRLGGPWDLVHMGMKLWRALWKLGTEAKIEKDPVSSVRYFLIRQSVLKAFIQDALPEHSEKESLYSDIIENFQTPKPLVLESSDIDHYKVNILLMTPLSLIQRICSDVLSDADILYQVRRNIRIEYSLHLTHQTVHLFHELAKRLSKQIQNESSSSEIHEGFGFHIDQKAIHSEVVSSYYSTIPSDDDQQSLNFGTSGGDTIEKEKIIYNLLIETCVVSRYVSLSSQETGKLFFFTNDIDPEVLLSNIFAFPVSIPGFNDLFGGGGLLLPENSLESTPDKLERLTGRTILVKGRYGTGKSLISMQLAAEVARKGGIAIVFMLEQTYVEGLYTLESMGALPKNLIDVITKTDKFKAYLDNLPAAPENKLPPKGALAIFPAENHSYKDLFRNLKEYLKDLKSNFNCLRMVIIDPINSLTKLGSDNQNKDGLVELRQETVDAIEEIEKTGTNLLLVAEENVNHPEEVFFETKIADTVISMGLNNEFNYLSRTIEISKSRFQREHRGVHHFKMTPGEGISVLLSPSAIHASLKRLTIPAKNRYIKFGESELDKALGTNGIQVGDLVAFQGSGGSLKTHLGLVFLKCKAFHPSESTSSSESSKYSLFIDARDDEYKIKMLLKSEFIKKYKNSKEFRDTDQSASEYINICSIPRGYELPGSILARIDHEFEKITRIGGTIDRVVFDNLGHWELGNPYVREDITFCDTLTDYFRRRNVTCLMICDIKSHTSEATQVSFQSTILDSADCIIDFSRSDTVSDSSSSPKVTLRIKKTRNMEHDNSSFTLEMSEQRPKYLSISKLSSHSESNPTNT